MPAEDFARRGLVRSDVAAILFDEPLTVIDPELKWQLRSKLKALHRDLDLTMIYVTMTRPKALTFADTVVVMHDGPPWCRAARRPNCSTKPEHAAKRRGRDRRCADIAESNPGAGARRDESAAHRPRSWRRPEVNRSCARAQSGAADPASHPSPRRTMFMPASMK